MGKSPVRIANKSQRKMIRVWLGFRESFLRERLKEDDIIACVMGGTHMAATEKNEAGLGCCWAAARCSVRQITSLFFFCSKLF